MVAKRRGRANNSIDPVDVAVGSHVRELRQARGISQSAFGAHLGVTFQQIQKYESGRNRVSASNLHHMASHMKVIISAFFEGLPNGPVETVKPLSGDAHVLALQFEKIEEPSVRKAVATLFNKLSSSGGADA
ncbi:helix-turn-helix transcriptional regulator [Rhizobium sp. 18065]|uniref:helix-turn-helix domain-containing protein n=1 Tax=Rhizobium sp. 18065 TaxID=2681411 RepID=UPI001356864B|nr:helix-turn-helix transcriptional regulator [Rhizobium sp. 18065]